MSGWVRIERKMVLADHEFFAPEPLTEREAWYWLLGKAAHKDTSHHVAGVEHAVPRGSYMTTLREMQIAWRWRSDKRVRCFLERLEKAEMIGRTKVGPRNAPKTHVTICKYEEYQAGGRAKDGPRTAQGRSKETNNNKQFTSDEVKAREILCEVVSFEQAGEFVAFRAELKKPITPRSARAMVSKLEGHHDPWGVLNNSIANSWQGIFPEKTKPRAFTEINGGQNGPASKSQARVEAFIGGATAKRRAP